jgi:hypothetical protein
MERERELPRASVGHEPTGGGMRRMEQERFQPGEGRRPEALQLEGGGRFAEPAFDRLTGIVERLQRPGQQVGDGVVVTIAV